MARKNKKSSSKRSAQKILDAFQIAERAENGYDNNSDASSDGDDLPVHDGIMDARKFLGKDQDNNDDFDDEEILSDEALGSDDDFDVLNSKFSQTIRDKKKKEKTRAKNRRRGQENSESEEESEYDSIDESELVSLSQAWDMDDKDLRASKNLGKDIVLNDDWETESSEEDEDEDEEDEEESSEEEEQSEDEDIFENEDEVDDDINLLNTVSRLQSSIKKPVKERKRLVTETTDENEFNLPTNGAKLSLNDMISAVDSSVSKDAILIDEPLFGKDGQEKSKALSVPLPRNIQARNDRKVAYDITKEQVSKWQEAIEANLDAEHIHFPLNAPALPETNNAFDAEVEPSTDLEKKVQEMLKQSALLDEKNEATFEEIATAKLSKEDMRKRTNELRLMRDLMFRDEKRAKRLKKIKSKQYHRIKKKERLRNQELVEGSDAESDKEDHDMKRATERMNLKHKTNSKWAKSMIRTGLSKDAENRGELEEMLRQGERLRAKQFGYEDGDQSDEGISDVEKQYEQDEELDDKSREKLGKGVLAMDFMKQAEEKQRQENLRQIALMKQLRNGNDLEEFQNDPNSGINIEKNEGRRIYTPKSVSMISSNEEVNAITIEEVDLDNEKSLENKLSRKFNNTDNIEVKTTEQPEEKTENKSDDEAPEVNPWLADEETTKRSKNVHTVDQTSSKLSKSAAKIAKVANKRSRADRDKEDSEIIDMEQAILINKGGVLDSDEEDNESDSGDVRMFKQKNLIKQAFAGDDVVQEFEAEKRQVIEDEGDKEEDLTLPGWGGWAGDGVTEQPKKKFVRKINGVVQEGKRKDKNLKNVIINERVNKKNLKYQSGAVPYPFESKEQYERSLRMPIGQQWTSKETHQKLTMPRIIKKQGHVIDPMKAPFK